MRVTCDALAVETDLDAWRQRLRHARLARPPAGRRGRASRSVQRTKHRRSKDIEYRVEARIDEHSEDVQLKQSTLDETYNRRVGVEQTNDAVRTAASGTFAPGPRPRAQVFLALCLRLVIAITNDERGTFCVVADVVEK